MKMLKDEVSIVLFLLAMFAAMADTPEMTEFISIKVFSLVLLSGVYFLNKEKFRRV